MVPGDWKEPGASRQASRGLLAWGRALWTLSLALQAPDCTPQEVGARPSRNAQTSRTPCAAAGQAPSPKTASSADPVSGVRSRRLQAPQGPWKEHVPHATHSRLLPSTLLRPGQAPLP